MRRQLPRRLRAALALSALNFLAGPDWHVFASDQGRLWATTTSAEGRDYRGVLYTGLPDAIDADSPAEMAAKLRARLEQCRPR